MKQLLLILTLIFSFNAIAVEEFPVEHFFKDPAMTGPQLSPDGQYMAALTPLNINRETVARCKKKIEEKNLVSLISVMSVEEISSFFL